MTQLRQYLYCCSISRYLYVCSTEGVYGSAANCFLVCLEHVKQLEAYTHPAQEMSECVRNRDSESESERAIEREGGREGGGRREGGRESGRERRQREREREEGGIEGGRD